MINEIIADLIFGGIILVFPVSALIMQKIDNEEELGEPSLILNFSVNE